MMRSSVYRVAVIALLVISAGRGLAMTSSVEGSSSAEAEDAPRAGTINQIDSSEGMLEVDGMAYRYSSGTVEVRDKDGKSLSSQRIRPGLKVDFRSQPEGGGRRITAIRIVEEPD